MVAVPPAKLSSSLRNSSMRNWSALARAVMEHAESVDEPRQRHR